MTAPLAVLSDAELSAIAGAYERKVRLRRRQTYGLLVLLLVLSLLAARVGEVDLAKLFANFHQFTSYFYRIAPELRLAHLWSDVSEWMWNLDGWAGLLADTVLIAYCGTLVGFVGGFSLCFFASANVMPSARVRFLARRTLEFCRSVPEIVFAQIFILAFKLGPLPGVLAIALHTAGALGKLFTEVTENIAMQPVEGVRASGGGWFSAIRFGVLPQVLPVFASYTLLRFEVNVRGATVIGFVGAGGIGQDFLEAVRKFYYSDVSAILVLIILTVFCIDILSEALRAWLIRGGAKR